MAETDLISRQAAIDALYDWSEHSMTDAEAWHIRQVIGDIKSMPSAQPEIKPIEYRDCANAMLRMWMDNVVTDGEYNRVMDKLNAHWRMKNE